jgi:DnaJ-class molecular chaperone
LSHLLMQNHYQILGVNTSATVDELRRAYRILARRYHPDVNPGRASEERFKLIAEAYATLSDPKKRAAYDLEIEKDQRKHFDTAFATYNRSRRTQYQGRRPSPQSNEQDRAQEPGQDLGPANKPRERGPQADFSRVAQSVRASIGQIVKRIPRPSKGNFKPRIVKQRASVSIIEISIGIKDAIFGIKKVVEISEPTGPRKISVRIPAGVRNGSVIRLRASESKEELVLIIRVASHPVLSMLPKGLVMEVPITVHEAVSGASFMVPTLDEPTTLKVPPGTQSGTEIRLKEKGVEGKEGRGDLFIRIMIRVPEAIGALGLDEKGAALDAYYESSIRQNLPKSIQDI